MYFKLLFPQQSCSREASRASRATKLRANVRSRMCDDVQACELVTVCEVSTRGGGGTLYFSLV